jgi:hypothetical protein
MSTTAVHLHERRRWLHRSLWWARRQPEQPDTTEICAKDGETGRSPFDLYCRGTDEHFLLAGGSRVLQQVLLNGFRVAVGALVLAAAAFDSAIPMYLAAWLIGLSVLVLPLRAFRASRSTAFVIWSGSLALAAADYEKAIDGMALRICLTVLAVAVVIGAMASVAFHPFEAESDEGEQTSPLAVRSAATGMVFGVTVLVGNSLDATGLGAYLVDLSGGPREALVFAGFASLTGAAAVAATAGFLRGVRVTDRRVTPLLKRELTRAALRVPKPASLRRPQFHQREVAARFVYAINAFAFAAVQRLIDAINAVLLVLSYAVLVLRRTGQRLVNSLHRLVVLAARALLAALLAAVQLLREAAVGVVGPLRHYQRSTVASIAALTLAATLAVYASDRFTLYLAHGGLGNGVLAIFLAIAVTLLLPFAWWTLTRWPSREVRAAAERLITRAGPTAYILLLALAWGDGVLGWLGVGPIRPGWLTGIGSAALAVIYVMHVVGERRRPAANRVRGARS